ncbi:hypothetical protein [Tenacibaculum sp. A30]|uniref:hypothetical protein n=1 Tax=Tenacibaculum sp. A30 TaxID=3442644 RepID=UPI003EBD524B
MKNRKSKIANIFKTTILLIVFSLLLVNCENENLIETQNDFINKVKNKINTDLMELPYTKDNLTVDWNNYTIIKKNDIEYYEFKTEFIHPLKNNSEILNTPSFYLIAYKSNNIIEIKYLEIRAYDYSLEKKPINFIKLGSFSGSFRYFNINGNLENSEAYIEGYLIKSDIENYLTLKRVTYKGAKSDGTFQAKVQPCTEVPSVLYVHETTHHYTDYYNQCNSCTSADGKIYQDNDGNTYIYVKTIYNGFSTQTYTYTTYSCDTPHTGDEVYKSEYLREQELIDAYECDCECSGTETEYTTDLDSNMEPKWGQLATRQEILNEISSIDNLSNLSFDKQIDELINHFNQNLKYSTTLPIKILNPENDVNRYIYTGVAGWLDFHHVFKLFKWARDKGPINALLAGEMGELIQNLKGNYSAYSYEDLPSNNVGVALFLRFGQQLQNGTLSWQEAVGKALDEMKSKQPESAPNFNYIPFLLKENYPKNFTYKPLTGLALEQYHKKEFCKLTLSQQNNIKEVHKNFRR